MNPVIEHLPKSQKKEQRPGVLTKPLPPYLSPAIPSSDRKANTQLSSCSPFGEEKSHREGRNSVEENKESPILHHSTVTSEQSCPHPGWGEQAACELCEHTEKEREGGKEEGKWGGKEEEERREEGREETGRKERENRENKEKKEERMRGKRKGKRKREGKKGGGRRRTEREKQRKQRGRRKKKEKKKEPNLEDRQEK